MKKQQIKEINFEGGQLLGVQDEYGKIYLGIKKACKEIGLTEDQAKRQVKNVQSDIVLNKGVSNLTLLTNGGEQEVLCISEEFVTLWLAKISLTPKMQKDNPQVVEKLISYQLRCAKILHEAFMATEEQKQQFFDEIGLKGEIVELKTKIEDMDKTMGTLINSATINSYQAKQLNKLVRERISTILGGAHSPHYKKNSRMYFKNLWLNLCDRFSVSEYRDLNPLNFNDAVTYVNNWSMN